MTAPRQVQNVVVSPASAGEVSIREGKPAVARDVVSPTDVGKVSIAPPTFLER